MTILKYELHIFGAIYAHMMPEEQQCLFVMMDGD
jgi:hypothetical protein